MRVVLDIESLKCTSGGSNKGYQLLKVNIDGVLLHAVRIHGPLDGPKQLQAFGDGMSASEIENDHFNILKGKLKKYNRHSPADAYEWRGDIATWRSGGGDFIEKTLIEHGPWVTGVFTGAFREKIDTLVRAVELSAGAVPASDAADTRAEDLFRTARQREQAEQEKQEAQALENWGAF